MFRIDAVGGMLMDRLAGDISIMWFAIGALSIASVFGFLFLWSRVYKEIDKSTGVARVYAMLHR